jgi:acyl carrier protein
MHHVMQAGHLENEKSDGTLSRAEERSTSLCHQHKSPSGKVEAAVAEIWAEVLGLERVGRQDNFFELGGRSLLVVQVAVRLHQRLGTEIGVKELYESPVLSDFARVLENLGGMVK